MYFYVHSGSSQIFSCPDNKILRWISYLVFAYAASFRFCLLACALADARLEILISVVFCVPLVNNKAYKTKQQAAIVISVSCSPKTNQADEIPNTGINSEKGATF